MKQSKLSSKGRKLILLCLIMLCGISCTLEPCKDFTYSTVVINSKSKALTIAYDHGEGEMTRIIEAGKNVTIDVPSFSADTGSGSFFVDANCGVVDQAITCSCSCDYTIK